MGRRLYFNMAARSILRAASVCRRNLVVSPTFSRRQSIFTKYREPPNGFLFNEKVIGFVVAFLDTNYHNYITCIGYSMCI